MYIYNRTFEFKNVKKDEIMQVEVNFYCGENLEIVDWSIVDGDRDDDGNLKQVTWIDKEYITNQLYALGTYDDFK